LTFTVRAARSDFILIFFFAEKKVILLSNHIETGENFHFDLKSPSCCVVLILIWIHSICDLFQHWNHSKSSKVTRIDHVGLPMTSYY